jgi:S1-C subfamily serine protease
MVDLPPSGHPARRGERPRLVLVALVALVAGALGAGLTVAVAGLAGGDDAAATVTVSDTADGGGRAGWAGVAARAEQGVVLISATVLVDRQVPPGFESPGEQETTATGSGFVIDQQGHLLTCQHVVDGATGVRVTFADGSSAEATVVGSDASTDLAVLKVDVDVERLHPLALATDDDLRVGEAVLALGAPFGFEGSASAGIVSGLGREIVAPNGYTITDAIQTDAALNHGNSGGPLLDAAGRVVGVGAQIADSGVDANVGVAFAVPIDAVTRRIVDDLRDGGSTTHAYLGIAGQTIDAALAEVDGVPADAGVLVTGVAADSPADRAGLRPGTQTTSAGGVAYCVGGDAITAIDGDEVRRMGDLQNALEDHAPGDVVTLTVARAGADGTSPLEVTLGTQPTTPPTPESGC